MAAGDKKIGIDGAFLYGTAGSTPTTEATNVDNVVLTLGSRMAEAVERGKTWVTKKTVVLEGSLTFEILDIEGDSFMSDLKSAYLNKTRIALYPRDDDSGDGLDADFYISDFSRNESNTEFIKYNVTADPTNELRDPSWT